MKKFQFTSMVIILAVCCSIFSTTSIKAATCIHLYVKEEVTMKDAYTNDSAKHCYDRIGTTKTICKSCNAVVSQCTTNIIRVSHDIINSQKPLPGGSTLIKTTCRLCRQYSEVIMSPSMYIE